MDGYRARSPRPCDAAREIICHDIPFFTIIRFQKSSRGNRHVANFIRCTEDRGIGKQFLFVNVDHIATARFDPETGILELTVAGTDSVNVHGEEAKAAVKKIESMM